MTLKMYSFDMDAIMGMSKEQLESVLRANEHEILELYNENNQFREKITKLEGDVRHLTRAVKTLESIKIEEKATNKFLKAIAAAFAAIGAIFGALFLKKDSN